MRTAERKKTLIPISKDKLKELIPIMDVARKFSPKMSERSKLPLIICPFHDDHNLGSCRVYPSTNTFKCEACGAHGDMLKLASGYLNIPLNKMNDLLESLTIEFGISRESVQVEPSTARSRPVKPPERLSPEEYTELLQSDHYSVPCRFEEIEYEKGEIDYVPVEYTHVYYRTLAIKDPEFHDWVICTVSRKFWLRYAEMAVYCQDNGYTLLEEVLQNKMMNSTRLLRKALINKSLYRGELRLRNEMLHESLFGEKESA